MHRTYSMVIENLSLCTIYESSVGPGFAKQIKSILRILRYNGSLVTVTIVSLATAKFKPLILFLCLASLFPILRTCSFSRCLLFYNVAYLLKARTVEPEKQPLLGKGCVTCNNNVTDGSGVFCAFRAEAM
jgi:hypothetical protein